MIKRRKDRVEQFDKLLGVDMLGVRREAAQVGEEHTRLGEAFGDRLLPFFEPRGNLRR